MSNNVGVSNIVILHGQSAFGMHGSSFDQSYHISVFSACLSV
jgi:hypothetical protein